MTRVIPIVLLVCGCLPASGQTAPVQANAGPQERTSYLRDIVVEKGETLHTVTCIFCSVRVLGVVKGEVVSIWGNIEIEGKVEGEAVAAGGGVVLRGDGAAEGEAVAVGGRVVRSGSGTVKGNVSEVPWIYLPGQRRLVFPGTLFFACFNILISMLYLAAGRVRVKALAETVRSRAVASFLVGAIAMTTLLAAFAWATDLETYDDEMMATVWIVMTLLVVPGCAGICLAIGRRVRREAGVAAGVFGGAVVITLLALIPLAGLLFFGIVWVFALGATFVGRLGFARARVVPEGVVSSEQ